MQHIEKTLKSISLSFLNLPLFFMSLLCGVGAIVTTYIFFHEKEQTYSALLTGSMVWGQGSKNGEYTALAFGLIIALLVYILLKEIFSIIERRSPLAAEGTRLLLTVCLSPALLWVSSLVYSSGVRDGNLLILSLIGCFATTIFGVLATSIPCLNCSADRTFCYLGGGLLALLFGAFSGLGLSLLLFRAGVAAGKPLTKIFVLSGMLISLAAISFILLQGKKHKEKVLTKLKKTILLSQCGLPLLFIYLIPPQSQDGSSPIFVSPWLYVLVSLLTGLAYREIYVKIRKNNNELAFSSLALVAIVLFIKIPVIDAGWYPADFYHHGEYLLPWKLWSNFGQIPYWDHAAVRGLDNYLSSIFADLFFEPTAPGYAFGETITTTLYIGIAFFCLQTAIGSLPALVCLILYPTPLKLFGINLVCAACFCYLFVARNRYDLKFWPTLWILLGTSLVLYAPSQGGLVVLATLPIGIYWVYRAFKEDSRGTLKLLCIALAVLGIVFLATPCGKMLVGALRYGIEQARINVIANGIPLKTSAFRSPSINYLLWEVIRFSWLIVGFLSGCLAYSNWRRGDKLCPSGITAMGFAIFLLALVYIPRAAGRIDPGGLSRPGIASLAFLFIYLPLLLFQKRTLLGKVAITMLLFLLLGLFPFSLIGWDSIRADNSRFPLLSFSNLDRKAGFRLRSSEQLVDASKYGFPALGMTEMPKSALQELSVVKRTLAAFVEPGGTYLDLTSKNANYYIFNYPPPIESSAVYNLISREQQDRAIQRLEANPPAIVYAWPAILHDGGSATLRSHRVSRYVINHYTPFSVGKHIFYAKAESLKHVDADALDLIIPDNRLDLDSKVFWLPHMKGLPLSWGKSFNTISTLIRYVNGVPEPTLLHHVTPQGKNSYKINGIDPYLVFDLSGLEVNGQKDGQLLIDIQSNSNPSTQEFIEVFWANNVHGFHPDFSVKFDWSNGRMLVPLDSVPSWLLGGNVMSLRIDLPSLDGAIFTIKEVSFWQRREYSNSKPN
jgi:hypothetical protein